MILEKFGGFELTIFEKTKKFNIGLYFFTNFR